MPESEAPSDPLEQEGTLKPAGAMSDLLVLKPWALLVQKEMPRKLARYLCRAESPTSFRYPFYKTGLANAGDSLSSTVRTLSDLLNQVKDEQSYIVVRERTHRNTAESTNARVKWWSIFQLGVLVGEGIFQVWWLKRFFEVKRVV